MNAAASGVSAGVGVITAAFDAFTAAPDEIMARSRLLVDVIDDAAEQLGGERRVTEVVAAVAAMLLQSLSNTTGQTGEQILSCYGLAAAAVAER